jgi:hypothetical protein
MKSRFSACVRWMAGSKRESLARRSVQTFLRSGDAIADGQKSYGSRWFPRDGDAASVSAYVRNSAESNGLRLANFKMRTASSHRIPSVRRCGGSEPQASSKMAFNIASVSGLNCPFAVDIVRSRMAPPLTSSRRLATENRERPMTLRNPSATRRGRRTNVPRSLKGGLID